MVRSGIVDPNALFFDLDPEISPNLNLDTY